MSKKLTLAISPCPNDTFMFDALIAKKIDLKGYSFDVRFDDIDILNKNISVLDGSSADISKISCAVYPKVMSSYNILRSGAALGCGNAPLVVSRHKIYPDELSSCCVAIPGFDTTGFLLLKYAFGEIKECKSYLFSDIAEVVLSGEADAGVLIHEERFSYKEKGLSLVADLSTKWADELKLPIPLGVIVVDNSLDRQVQSDINGLIRASVEFGLNNPSSSYSFIREHARSMDAEVIKKHIEMFVNNYSIDISVDGEKAITTLLALADGTKEYDNSIFISV